MIDTYKQYVEKYIKPYINGILPGEHHFVAIYLAPKIYKATNYIPLYINPDGMKKVPGDLFYKENDVSIEVKYFKINFTNYYWMEWIKDINCTSDIATKKCPKYFIGVSDKGIIFEDWKSFVCNYKTMIRETGVENTDTMRIGTYSKLFTINQYINRFVNELSTMEYYRMDSNSDTNEQEDVFTHRIKTIFNL
jgi:hypothetical protein